MNAELRTQAKGRPKFVWFATAVISALVGAGLMVAGFRFTFLNWIVDGPGWVVSRFVSIDFHEGDGAGGFLLAVLLSWALATATVWLLLSLFWRRYRSRD